jgi:hypothetical protein
MGTEWQPLTWILFHTIALNYNDNYKNEYYNFFDTFKTIIPCKICRDHYIGNISKEDMNFDNNINIDKIFNWTVDLHNIVNKMNHKKVWSYEEARKNYENNTMNHKMLKFFLFEYIRANFKKNPSKTTELLKMIKTIPYVLPDSDKKNMLIEFKEKFELNRNTLKQWLLTFLIILKK